MGRLRITMLTSLSALSVTKLREDLLLEVSRHVAESAFKYPPGLAMVLSSLHRLLLSRHVCSSNIEVPLFGLAETAGAAPDYP